MALGDHDTNETELQCLRRELQAVAEDARQKFSAELLAQYQRISEQILIAERAVAQAQGLSFAEPLSLPYDWTSSSSVRLFAASAHSALIAYDHLKSTDGIAVIRLKALYKIIFGGPNDEVREGHPLSGRGLATYGAFVVRRSDWIRKEKTINSVHDQYSEGDWLVFSHFIFCFHDIQVEAIARDLEYHLFSMSLESWRPEM